MSIMLAQLHETCMIRTTNGKVCIKQKKLPVQGVKLQCSLLQTSMLKACNNFRYINASHSNTISSMLLARRNCHAHLQQGIHGNHEGRNTSYRKVGVGNMQTTHNMEMQQRQQDALDYVVPKYTPPFICKMNPNVEEANKLALVWFAHHFQSSMSPKNFQDICLVNCHYLAGASYPEASISCLEFVIEFMIWLFTMDDESLPQRSTLEELVQFQQETQAVIMSTFPEDKSLQDNLQKYLNDERAFEYNKDFLEKVLAQVTMKPLLETDVNDHQHLSPIASSFQDLWIKAISVMSKEWSLRFAKVLLEFIEDISLPDTIYYSVPMQRLCEATADAVCWINDVWSFPKELVAGEVANLVFLIGKEKGCSYNKAAQIVAQMLMDKFKEVQIASMELKEYCKNHQATTLQMVAIDHYISCCNNFVSAAHLCYSQSARYQRVQNISK
ncbi:hypothetical protein CY35_11G001100 [Sphagnum magellanicum]|nr:hypothetical protein CY35_11G001100 [Sphagnum magellanicum]